MAFDCQGIKFLLSLHDPGTGYLYAPRITLGLRKIPLQWKQKPARC